MDSTLDGVVPKIKHKEPPRFDYKTLPLGTGGEKYNTMKFIIFILILAGLGYWYYTSHPTALKQAQDAAVQAQATGKTAVDNGTMASLGGANKVAKIYYVNNNDYGKSVTKNICVDPTSSNGFGDIISGMKNLGSAVTCGVDTNYPSKSFTITVPSLSHKGQQYCTDQNASVVLVPILGTSGYVKGLQCK